MDDPDFQILVEQNSRSSKMRRIALIIIIISFILILGNLIVVIFIVTKVKDLNSDYSNKKENSQKEETSKKTGLTPIIGIPGFRYLSENDLTDVTQIILTNDAVQMHYIEAVETIGGVPISLPVLQIFNIETIKRQLDTIDGIIIQGGLDVDPFFYNETKDNLVGQTNKQTDRYLIEVIKQAYEKKMPILGICRGIQIMNVAFGVNLYQDLSFANKDVSHHKQNYSLCSPKHSITIKKGTILGKIYPNKDTLEVNSIHHQAIKKLAPNFEIDALSDDEVIESIHYKADDRWIFGVQFHPEETLHCGNDGVMPIFKEFIKQAQKYKDNK